MVYKMHLCGVAAYSAAPDRTAPYLRAAAAGQHLSTLAWSEFGSRSHFWAPVSQERTNDGMVSLSAAKSFVTSAGEASGYVVTTRAASAVNPTDTTLYLVLSTDPGLRVAAQWDGLGLRGNASGPMNLQNVPLSPDRALCGEGQGLGLMLNTVLPVFNLGNAAISLGIAEAAFKTAQHHVSTARFDYTGTKLADLPNERARLAQMRTAIDQARAHLAAAIDAVEDPGPATLLLVLEAKAAAGETAVQVTDMALRASGGTGFSKNMGLERNFRDARAALVMGPTTDVIYDFIGRALCGMEVF
jgi:alkylation response protein AidB-like acyl-CoA dehydrogenase